MDDGPPGAAGGQHRTALDWKREMVTALVEIHLRNFETSGVELILGSGSFVAPRTVQVELKEGGVRYVRGRHVVIGSGTRARLDSIPGLRDAAPLTHIDALELDVVPEHLMVLGGGYIGPISRTGHL